MIPFNMNGEVKGGLVYGDDGDDTFNVGSTGVLKDGATIYANAGRDTINISGKVINGAQIEGDEGYDTINIKSGAVVDNSSIYGDGTNEDSIFDEGNEINIDGTVQNGSSVYGGYGSDIVNINGTVEGSYINTRSGNDTISIGKDAHIQGSSTIDGGDGFDTLKIADNNVDFSQVQNIEKLDMTNREKTNLNLSASDVQNILRDSNESTLRIDGEKGDTLKLTDGGWDSGHPSLNDGYTIYSNGTTTIEVKDEVHVF